MSYQVGEKIVLIDDYNGYKKGTTGLYLGHTYDSGSYVPIMVIVNDDFYNLLKLNNVSTLGDLVNLRNSIQDGTYLTTYLRCVKPDEVSVTSLSKASEKARLAQESLNEAKQQVLWLTSSDSDSSI
jgi:hypothetical protein